MISPPASVLPPSAGCGQRRFSAPPNFGAAGENVGKNAAPRLRAGFRHVRFFPQNAAAGFIFNHAKMHGLSTQERKKTMKTGKTALAALILSCCLPFSAALAGDYEDMKDALDKNLQAMRQVRANVQNTREMPWKFRKHLMDGAQWEIDRAVERQTAFNRALNNIKARDPHNAVTNHLTHDLNEILPDLKAIYNTLDGGVLVKDVAPFISAHETLCENYNEVNIAGAQKAKC